MKKTIFFPVYAACVLLFASCQEPAKQDAATAAPVVAAEPAKPDLAKIRSEIVAVETAWATAQNAKDGKALMALYSEDAISMPDGEPMLSGKAAIQKKQEADFAKPSKYASIAFETMDVYAQGDVVTEVGKTMYKDAAGKTIGGGKYFAVFEKKDGKYLCIREIYNQDSK
ncbi:MAG: nuclear transport factor 2 family protein [Ferruginibacter sp.]